jgi:outer membrane lipoprotein LolB
MAQFCRRLVIAWAVFLLAGCASTLHSQGADGAHNDHWQGRLAVTLYSRPVQAFAASFELQGNAQVGSLYFFTPLGSTAAQLHWDADGAQLQTSGDPQRFESLDALTLYTTGASLPIASLFAWLQGQESDAPGWTVDLHDLANGRLLAQRLAPQTPAELKIILER